MNTPPDAISSWPLGASFVCGGCKASFTVTPKQVVVLTPGETFAETGAAYHAKTRCPHCKIVMALVRDRAGEDKKR